MRIMHNKAVQIHKAKAFALFELDSTHIFTDEAAMDKWLSDWVEECELLGSQPSERGLFSLSGYIWDVQFINVISH